MTTVTLHDVAHRLSKQHAHAIAEAHERAASHTASPDCGQENERSGPPRPRALVSDSWNRCLAAGVDPGAGFAPLVLDTPELRAYRGRHELGRVVPLINEVLGAAALACDSLLAIADQHGRLLWLHGPPQALRRAEAINFLEGTAWDESSAGTNAVGTALQLGIPVQIRGPEHFAQPVQAWSCTAAPIRDPATGQIIGAIDVTGGRDVESPQALAMVLATARLAETELARLQASDLASTPPLGRTNSAPARWGHALPAMTIEALGRDDCQVTMGEHTRRLSQRHSEILLILAGHPNGLTGDQLAVELNPEDAGQSTLRAEMTRLRSVLGACHVDSRPYRLTTRTRCDWMSVETHLDAGRLAEALSAYRGPLLPRSEAPYVVNRRERLDNRLRRAVLDRNDADLFLAWTRTTWGCDDLDMWHAQTTLLTPGSALHSIARAEAARLDITLR